MTAPPPLAQGRHDPHRVPQAPDQTPLSRPEGRGVRRLGPDPAAHPRPHRACFQRAGRQRRQGLLPEPGRALRFPALRRRRLRAPGRDRGIALRVPRAHRPAARPGVRLGLWPRRGQRRGKRRVHRQRMGAPGPCFLRRARRLPRQLRAAAAADRSRRHPPGQDAEPGPHRPPPGRHGAGARLRPLGAGARPPSAPPRSRPSWRNCWRTDVGGGAGAPRTESGYIK